MMRPLRYLSVSLALLPTPEHIHVAQKLAWPCLLARLFTESSSPSGIDVVAASSFISFYLSFIFGVLLQ